MTAPPISAVIPLYDGKHFIARALRSVAEQTLRPVETIVVDDGSSDQGVEVVRSMASSLPEANIVLLRQDNAGQSAARNSGVAHATGRLVAFLDQDDFWYPQHLERLVKPFLRSPPGRQLGWVYSDLDEADAAGLMIHHNYLTVIGPGDHPKTTLYRCLDRDMFVLPSASLIDKEVFTAVGGFDPQLCGYEDDDLFLRMFRAGYNNVFLPVALARWCIHHASASYSPRMRRSRMVYFRKLLATYLDMPERSAYLARDLILPRFYRHARVDYQQALKRRDRAAVQETLDDLRSIVSAAAQGHGIAGVMTHQQAIARARWMRRLDPESAMRAYVLRRGIEPVTRRLPVSVLQALYQRWPLCG